MATLNRFTRYVIDRSEVDVCFIVRLFEGMMV